MNRKRLSKQQLIESQIKENKKFNRIMLISIGTFVLCLVSIQIFYTYRCETTYTWRKLILYGKEVPGKLACMNGDALQAHESAKVVFKNKTYYFCSQDCFNHLSNHFNSVAIVEDAVSGELINKADAIIGLKSRNHAELIYFKNRRNFSQYYKSKHKR